MPSDAALPAPIAGAPEPAQGPPIPGAYAVTLARREMRGGLRGFGVFLGCLVLGVAAIAGVGSLAAAVNAGIKANSRVLLGGDAEARVLYREPGQAERDFLASSGSVSEITTMRAMARNADETQRSLIDLKAVDSAYPLYGALTLAPAQYPSQAMAARDGRFGALVAPSILDRLNLRIGDPLRIGDALYDIRATIEREPDAAVGAFVIGPRVIVSAASLAASGLLRPGALVTYAYRLKLPQDESIPGWVARARNDYPQAGWRIRGYAEASPALERFIDRIGQFMTLVGLTSLLVGGVGIGNAVRGYVAAKTPTIATLKGLGASNRLVISTYLTQIMTIAAGGILTALAIGAALPRLIAPLIEKILPVPLDGGVHFRPLALAALFGVVTTLLFSLWPLAGIGRISAASLFRDAIAPAKRRIPIGAIMATGLAAAALAGLAVASAQERRIALWFVGGSIVAFALFRLAGAAIVWAAGKVGRPRHPGLRMALSNMHRPGTQTPQIVLSLGIGLTVLVAIALVQANIAGEIRERIPAEAPSFFFIDIQPDQLAGFGEVVAATPGARFDQVPMLRGRVTRLNGTPVEDAAVAPDAQWALRSDRGLTYAAAMPPGSRIVAGEWWPPDYQGPPLISFDAGLAEGMGLKPGDTLTVNLLGREITATIFNLRRIDWARLGINFAIVFAPGTLEPAPQTHLAAVYVPPAQEEALARQVTARFPNISAINVRDALDTVTDLVRTIGAAIRLTALVTLAAGALVLGGAIASGHRQRVYDSVVLKVLGATRGAITRAFLIEHGLIGLSSALVASGLGTLAAYFMVTNLMKADWQFYAAPLVSTVAMALALTLGLGFVGTWRALGAKPATYLRNE